MRRASVLAVVLWGVLGGRLIAASGCPDTLADPATVKSPPPDCRMIAWWMWFGSAVTKPEVLRELTRMHQAGLGGVLVYPEYPQQVDDPALGIKNLPFLSPQYLGVYRYAVETAHRLGMTVDVVGGSGWPYGGPSVSIEDAAHAIRMATVHLDPTGAVSLPVLQPDEKLVAVFAPESSNGGSSFRDVTSAVAAGGRASLPVPQQTEVLTFISTPTHMRVKRPSLGGEGYVLDHLSPSALNRYSSAVLSKLSGPVGQLRALFADSLEAYNSDWTAAFLDEFKRRRGYDLTPSLPYLFQDLGPRTEDTRFDFWETVADLFVDGYARPLHEWTRRHDLRLEIQAYGVPAVPQRTYALVDFPGGEQYDWKEFTEGRWASSAAHFYGKKRVLAEYATWAGIPNRFTDTLDDLKVIADMQFLTGMTELGASTLPYSPPSAGSPGWQDYAGAAFGINQTWWPFLPDLAAYVHRASFVLEQGRPVSDVLVYLPVEDAEANAPPGSLHTVFQVRNRLAQAKEGEIPEFGLKNALSHQARVLGEIIASGYTFDGISGDILEQRATIDGTHLEIGDASYAVVLLPRLTGIRLRALDKIAAFVRAGGTAVATGRLPDRVYGGLNNAADNERLRFLVEQVFGTGGTTDSHGDHSYGLGRSISIENESELRRVLLHACPPDLSLEKPDGEIGFIHRRARISARGTADYYFIANTGEEEKVLRASFRVARRQPQIWDLELGTATLPAVYAFQGDRTALELHLGPRRSVVVYFGASHADAEVAETNLPSPILHGGTVSAETSNPGTYFVRRASGREVRSVVSLPKPIIVSTPWKLQFGSPLNLSQTVKVLRSWTEDGATKYFSGTGTYSTDVNVPATFLGPDRVVWLDLGDVRYAARVWVNGQVAGDAWQRPLRLEISRWLRPGVNHLRIAVANLLINELLGQKPPDYTKLVAAYGDRFPYPEDWKVNPEPWPAGLLGPVRLVPGVRVQFTLHPGKPRRPATRQVKSSGL
ncbi:MAG TPA: glycosyl hydrolase [Terriglobia bacterium]|nr:glycosyl hydrolase [Terriglobia bacterium]